MLCESNNKSLMTTSQWALQCHFTCKYRVNILRVLDSPQQRLTYIFDILVNALDEQ